MNESRIRNSSRRTLDGIMTATTYFCKGEKSKNDVFLSFCCDVWKGFCFPKFVSRNCLRCSACLDWDLDAVSYQSENLAWRILSSIFIGSLSLGLICFLTSSSSTSKNPSSSTTSQSLILLSVLRFSVGFLTS